MKVLIPGHQALRNVGTSSPNPKEWEHKVVITPVAKKGNQRVLV
jgi:hypothetical protein